MSTYPDAPEKDSSWPRLLLPLLLFTVLLVVLALYFDRRRPEEPLPPDAPALGQGQLRLVLGDDEQVSGPVEIAVVEPVDFDGLSLREVVDLRLARVRALGALVDLAYLPSQTVFGGIADGAPWWGTQGHFFHGPGERSIDGPSEEARLILNPALLIAADFFGLSIWNDSFAWDTARIGPDQLARGQLPLWLEPAELTWWPRDRRGWVVYRVSGFISELNQWVKRPVSLADTAIALLPLNARDFGMHWMYLAPGQPNTLRQCNHSSEPFRIRSYLHRGGSCRHPGGCNNGSPYQAELDCIHLDQVPAMVEVFLWNEQPEFREARPDFRFEIRFE